MALYLGENKQRLRLNDILYRLNVGVSEPITTNVIKLLSSEGYILKDKNNTYLTFKEGE